MFSNIGNKIKGLAVAYSIIGSVWCVIMSGLLYAASKNPLCFALLIGGPLVSWISSFTIYGFGEIIVLLEHINIKLYDLKQIMQNDKNEKTD